MAIEIYCTGLRLIAFDCWWKLILLLSSNVGPFKMKEVGIDFALFFSMNICITPAIYMWPTYHLKEGGGEGGGGGGGGGGLICFVNATWRLFSSCPDLLCLVWPKTYNSHISFCPFAILELIGLHNVQTEYYICTLRDDHCYSTLNNCTLKITENLDRTLWGITMVGKTRSHRERKWPIDLTTKKHRIKILTDDLVSC